MRRLMAAGVPRGDVSWSGDLGNGLVSAAAQEEYQDFTRQLEAIPANERLKRVFDEHLWGPQAQAKIAAQTRSSSLRLWRLCCRFGRRCRRGGWFRRLLGASIELGADLGNVVVER
jgi:hypothetical protein